MTLVNKLTPQRFLLTLQCMQRHVWCYEADKVESQQSLKIKTQLLGIKGIEYSHKPYHLQRNLLQTRSHSYIPP